MKTLLFIVGIAILVSCIFCGGLLLGNLQHFTNALLQISTVDNALVDATKTFMSVSDLENGKVEDAKSFLNQELNDQIITLDQFLKDCPNDTTRQHVSKLLARIARHRQGGLGSALYLVLNG